VAEWSKAADCKSVALCFVGSNPILPIMLYFYYCMKHSHINKYYKTAFMQNKAITFSLSAYDLYVPLFNRQVFFFTCGGALLKVSKKNRNIDRTVWFATNIAKTHFIFIIPVYTNSLAFY
jgi:hypothetical protein